MHIEELAFERREAILAAKDETTASGQKYYVANGGDDARDGKSPETAWKTLERVSEADLRPGDAVLFRRGDLFRGTIRAKDGVTYAAYGEGEKPRLYGSECDLADPLLWELEDAGRHIWKCTRTLLDAGTLVFNHGEAHSRKLIPSYIGGKFVCRNAPEREFALAAEMTQDLDLFCRFDAELTTKPSKGEDFPIPTTVRGCPGEMYLRCDRGNPGEVFDSIETLSARNLFQIGTAADVHIDNLCIKYVGRHAIGAGGDVPVRNLHVSNCEIGWIGGCIQHYFGTDPNYPQGTRGTVTRYGNGVEIYGACDGFDVHDCWIYQVYDAGVTHQVTCFGKNLQLNNVRYHDNLIENCVYSIEYFLEIEREGNESSMNHIEMDHNILRLSGFGWGQQRHNTDTPAHIKGWSYVNTATQYSIHDNIFDRAGYRMLHLVALKKESLPKMERNTYAQHLGAMLGQYGANEQAEPAILPFDEHAAQTIAQTFGDERGAVVFAE